MLCGVESPQKVPQLPRITKPPLKVLLNCVSGANFALCWALDSLEGSGVRERGELGKRESSFVG